MNVRRLRTPAPWICAALHGLVALAVLGPRPGFAHDDPNPPLSYRVIGPAQERLVEKLLAPWRDGGPAAGGYRWDGAEIAGDRVCYRFVALGSPGSGIPAAARRLCLFAAEHPAIAQPQGNAAASRRLPADTALREDAAKPAGAADATRRDLLLEAVAERIAANAGPEGRNLAGLFHQPARQEVKAVRLVRPDDVLFWAPLFALWLLIAAARAGRTLPGGGWPWLAALVGLSALWRFTLPIQAPMTAWSWSRRTTLGTALQDSDLLHLWLWPTGGVAYDDAQALAMRVCSTLAPVALFGHGCKLFGDARPAWLAAALLACSPHAIRFAAADDQFTVSMLWSSAAFFWMYLMLEEERPWLRALRWLGLPPLTWLALTAQPLNLVFAPLLISAVFLAARRDALRWRLAVAATIATVGLVVSWGLLRSDGAAVQEALGWHSVLGAAQLLTWPSHNPLLFWRLTPPAWTALVVAGAVVLLYRPAALVGAFRAPSPTVDQEARREGDAESALTLRRRGLWLVAWTLGFIALHGVVVVDEPLNNARYQLHSLPAMALLGGVGLAAAFAALRAGRLSADGAAAGGVRAALPMALLVGLAALLLLSPLLHLSGIQDVNFDVMRERAFLDRAAAPSAPGAPALLPQGCAVVEIMRPRAGPPASKLDRVGTLLAAEPSRRWRRQEIQRFGEFGLVAADAVPAARASTSLETARRGVAASVAASAAASGPAAKADPAHSPYRLEEVPEAASLSAAGRALLRDATGCLIFYEGPECSLRPGSAARHPACEEVLQSGPWQLLAEERFAARIYDRGLSWHLRDPADLVELRLWRRSGPRP